MRPALPLLAGLLLALGVVPSPGSGAATADRAALAAAPDEALGPLWDEAQELERAGALAEAGDRFELIARTLPSAAEPRWRLARNHWRQGERLPVDRKEERLLHFERAEELARESIALDPRCGECLFWRAVALGRIMTTEGVIASARKAPVIAELLERTIALRPAHRDSDENTTLGNAYYAAATMYRLVPEWRWLSWVLGVRGDKERSVAYSREAVAISPTRFDYQVELGAGLLCLGTTRDRPALVREGRDVLRGSESLVPFENSAIDRHFARAMLERPDLACAFTRDGWLELDENGLSPTDVAAGG